MYTFKRLLSFGMRQLLMTAKGNGFSEALASEYFKFLKKSSPVKVEARQPDPATERSRLFKPMV